MLPTDVPKTIVNPTGVIVDLQPSITSAPSIEQYPSPLVNYVDCQWHYSDFSPQFRRHNRPVGSIGSGNGIACGQPGCWSTIHPLRDRMNALYKNKQIRELVAQFENNSIHDSNTDCHDAIDDLAAHLLYITELIPVDDYDTQPDQDFYHVAPNIFHHPMVYCTLMHSFTNHIPSTSPHTLTAKTNTFRGILIDTGAARGNTSSMDQYIAYCYHFGWLPCIGNSKAAMCHLEIDSEISQETASISFPLGPLTVTFHAHILLDTTMPLLVSIDELNHRGLYFNNKTNYLIHMTSWEMYSYHPDATHALVKWNSIIHCYYTAAELCRLHRRLDTPMPTN